MKPFTQALIVRSLDPDGQLNFHEVWDLKDNAGKLVPAGQYTIEVRVLVGLKSGTVSPDELTANSVVEVE